MKSPFLALLLVFSPALADSVKLKTGETLEGRITYEGSDFIKLEVAVSATIKDTKVIPRTEIAEIVKEAPDVVALGDLRKKLPAPSLMTAQGYRNLIEAGPKRFLTEFPNSSHKAEVEKVLADLSDELDKVERGFLKVEGEWISPQDRKQFQAVTESRIRGVSFQRKIAQRDNLGALRDYEVLEERYFGTPAHVATIGTVKELLPTFGSQLTRALKDVEYRNQKWEQDKAVLDEVARLQVEQARAQEIAAFEQAVTQEKAADVKWISISQNSTDSLSGAIEQVRAEIDRLNAIDLPGLTAMSQQLVEADKLIAEKKIEEAAKVIEEAQALYSGEKPSTRRKGSRSQSSSSIPTSYAGALYGKIDEVEAERELARQQAEEAAKGAEATSVIKAGESGAPLVDASAGEAAPAGDEGAGAGGEGETAEASGGATDQGSALTGLMAAGKDSEEGKDSGNDSGKSGSSPKKKTEREDEDEDEDDRDRAVAADEGGGLLNFQNIMYVVAGLLVVTVVTMKVLGVGGKKAG